MKLFFLPAQTLFVIIAAPLLSGLIKKIKNNLRMRLGASPFQPYYNLAKLFKKEEVISQNSSWIFKVTPYLVLTVVLAAINLVPVFDAGAPSPNPIGNLLTFVFLMAFARFFLCLSGLDTASVFTGMGSSREMFISGLAEPVMLLAIFTISLNTNASACGFYCFRFSSLIAAIALFLLSLAETSRIPVDNQETHLELTMVHKALVLEYSGRSLALIELSFYIKQMLFFSILANIIPPFTLISNIYLTGLAGISIYFLKIIVICLVVAFVEVSLAKMRLFRVVDFLGFAFVLSLISVVVFSLGW